MKMNNTMSEATLGGQFTFPGTSLRVQRMGYGAMQLALLVTVSRPKVMFDFTLSLQPVIQFMTLLPAPCFEELVSTFADEVRDAFDGTATRVRSRVHFRQFPTSGNLRDYSHIQSPPLSSTTPILGPVEARRNRCPLSATT